MGGPPTPFDETRDLLFRGDIVLPGHPNGVRFTAFDRAGAIFGDQYFVVVRQRPLHLGANFAVVVNNEQFGFHQLAFGSGKKTRKVVPLPGWLATSTLPLCASTIILL